MRMLALFFSQVAAMSTAMAAEKITWFSGSDIDYWNEGRVIRGPHTKPKYGLIEELPPNLPPSSSIIRSADFLPFDWSRYENPLSPEFWDDGGNYVPPRPLRILAANPTDDNLRRYREWQFQKTEATIRLSRLLSGPHSNREHSDNNAEIRVSENSKPREGSVRTRNDPLVEWPSFSVSVIYRTSCAHCKAMAPVFQTVVSRGAKIQFYQISTDTEKPAFPGSKPIADAELNRLGVTVTPTLFIRKQEKTIKIEGYMSFAALEQEVRDKF